ncbi:unnamed protein product [Laminaria digitata]
MNNPTNTDISSKAAALDKMVAEGNILEAVELFFHPKAITQEGNATDLIEGKAAKIEHLKTFFAGIGSVNAINLHSTTVGDNVSMSEFTFDLTQKDGTAILWNEVLRRNWEDGLVIHERYYTA